MATTRAGWTPLRFATSLGLTVRGSAASILPCPSLPVVQNVMLTTVTVDFSCHVPAFEAAAKWDEERPHFISGLNVRAPHVPFAPSTAAVSRLFLVFKNFYHPRGSATCVAPQGSRGVLFCDRLPCSRTHNCNRCRTGRFRCQCHIDGHPSEPPLPVPTATELQTKVHRRE